MKYKITNATIQIDKIDLPIVESRRWHKSSTGYAVWRGIENGKKITIRLHRLIAQSPTGMVTDHINHDKLDNRRSNLKVCTQSENMRNRTNQGKGYWYQKQNNNWVVEVHGKHIGCFDTEEEAASVVTLIRNGGTYKKPERTVCRRGHTLTDAYDYGKGKRCRKCQSIRSKEYYERKTKQENVRNNGKETR